MTKEQISLLFGHEKKDFEPTNLIKTIMKAKEKFFPSKNNAQNFLNNYFFSFFLKIVMR